MVRGISRLISLIVVIAFIIIFIYAAFFTVPEPKGYEMSYDNKEGVITIQLEEAIPDGERTARIYLEPMREYSEREVITEHGMVKLSSDRSNVTVTADSTVLVNLENGNYQVYLVPADSSLKTLEFELSVNNHEFSTTDLIGIGICMVLLVLVVAFLILRRLVRGR